MARSARVEVILAAGARPPRVRGGRRAAQGGDGICQILGLVGLEAAVVIWIPGGLLKR